MTALNLRATTALASFLLFAAPAAGQNSQQPVIITPPVGNFSLPPSGQTPTPAPRPSPTSAPSAVSTPRAITPRPIPVVTPTPTPRPAATRPATLPVPGPSPTPARPPNAQPSPLPALVASQPAPAPTMAAPPAPVTSPTPAASPAMTETALPVWLWPALGAAVLLLLAGAVGGWLLGRRRRMRQEEDVDAAPVPVQAPVSPPTPGPPPLSRSPAAPPPPSPARPAPPPSPPAPPPAGTLVTELRPLRAAIRDGLVTLEFELFVQNRGTENADNVRAVLALLGANAQQDEQIAQFQAAARLAAGSEPFSIAPGGVYMLNGQVSLPDGQMPAVTVQGKPMFVPVVPVVLRWYAGLSIRTLRDSFMVGTIPAPGGDRLGPLWVERAASGFGRLAAKRYVPKRPDA